MKKNVKIIAGLIMAWMLVAAAFTGEARADEAQTVEIGVTDYEALTMEIIRNGNTIIYSSLDNKKTWSEIDGVIVGDKLIMDIQFASSASDVNVWLKGDKDSKVIKVVIPKQSSTFKAKYDRGTGTIVMSGYEDRTTFRWHKSTDDNYQTVSFDTNNASYRKFENEIEKLTTKGAKIMIGLPGRNGTGIDDMGVRPVKEVTVTIPKRSSAPNVKINVTKLTLNTRDKMEYQVIGSGDDWKTCTKNMSVSDIAPSVLYENGSKTVAIKFRNAATSSRPASLESFVTIKGQNAGPAVGTSGKDVKIEAGTGKLAGKTIITFNTASKTAPVEYKIVKPNETEVNYTKGWKAIKQAGKVVKLSERQLPKGSKVLFRFKGINANASKGIEAVIPSAYITYNVA
ncbi:MAG: hypothetical protein K6F93_07230 [Lachnospiraceae bacterium]|nr:hypothetical protein [Lachnospiraceae bacterium]